MATRKPFNLAWLLSLIIPMMLIIAAIVFLNSSDSYGTYTITGRQVLEREWPSFWVWVKVCTPLSLVFFGLLYLNATGAWIGKYMPGSMGLNILFMILALACLIGPWIAGLEAKANGGATLPKNNTQIIHYEYKHHSDHKSPGSNTYRAISTHYTDGIPVTG